MEPRFPIYAKHEDAVCFMCRRPLNGKPEESGYPARYGQYRQQCDTPGCYQHTYYDLEEAHGSTT